MRQYGVNSGWFTLDGIGFKIASGGGGNSGNNGPISTRSDTIQVTTNVAPILSVASPMNSVINNDGNDSTTIHLSITDSNMAFGASGIYTFSTPTITPTGCGFLLQC